MNEKTNATNYLNDFELDDIDKEMLNSALRKTTEKGCLLEFSKASSVLQLVCL